MRPEWAADLDALLVMPPRWSGAEWADRERVLGAEENASRPGRWRTEAWQAGILDAMADPQLDWIVVLKAAQMGVSELVRCAIGRWARIDPGDVLWVMATEPAAKKAMRKLHAMFRNTPSLRGLKSPKGRDTSLLEMRLINGMRIVIGWAGSAQSLASDPFRYVILDETGLYPAKVGKEGSPIRLAEERVKTYGRRAKVVLLSKPAHPDDLITSAYEECLDRRQFALPCEVCETLQPLEWGAVRWPGGDPSSAPSDPVERVRLAGRLEAEQSAWIECRECGEPLGETHAAMRAPASKWTKEEDTDTPTRRRAFHISELYHWARSTSDLAARYLRCVKPADLQEFHTGSLGRPYEAQRGEVNPGLFARRAIYPALEVPKWSTAVLATADTQKDHFWFMVRAWGQGKRSRLIDWGRVDSFDELEARTLLARFPVAGTDEKVSPQLLLIDAGGTSAEDPQDGSRTHQVYAWCSETPGTIPLKGRGDIDAQRGTPMAWGKDPLGFENTGLRLATPNTAFFKDSLMRLIRASDPILWEECVGADDPEYGRQMTGQVLVREENTKGRVRWLWKKRKGRHDHLFDCAAYQVVAAEIAHACDDDAERIVTSLRQQKRAGGEIEHPFRRDEEPAGSWVRQGRRGSWL